MKDAAVKNCAFWLSDENVVFMQTVLLKEHPMIAF